MNINQTRTPLQILDIIILISVVLDIPAEDGGDADLPLLVDVELLIGERPRDELGREVVGGFPGISYVWYEISKLTDWFTKKFPIKRHQSGFMSIFCWVHDPTKDVVVPQRGSAFELRSLSNKYIKKPPISTGVIELGAVNVGPEK